MYFGGMLLLEEHVLGEKKVKDLQSQVLPIFEAIIKSFKKRLENNRLNLPNSKILAFQQFLERITVNVGGMPKDKNHRLFVKDYYADLDFDRDDDLHVILLKTSMLRTRRHLEKLDYTVTSNPYTLDIPNVMDFNTINLPYAALLEPSFMTRGHDVFKVNTRSVIILNKFLNNIFFYCSSMQLAYSLLDKYLQHFKPRTPTTIVRISLFSYGP